MSVEANQHVAIVLMKGDEADATLDVLRADHPQVRISDQGSYWHLQADGEIVIDIRRVGEELGEDLALSDWLVVMSTFVGRVVTDPWTFTVTSELPDIHVQRIDTAEVVA